MPAIQKLAMNLVDEVPVTRLQDLLGPQLNDTPVIGGGFCGGGCRPGDSYVNGTICGFSCRPVLTRQAQDVIDPDGALGLTSEDLANVRNDLPNLRHAVASEIEKHLSQLK